MAIERIPCGGWYIDNTTLTFDENKVLSVVGGGGTVHKVLLVKLLLFRSVL